MKDLNYDYSLYYSLKEKHKSLEIKDFKTKNILGSNYIQKNHDLPIQSTPHFINERTVNQLLKKSYHLPIIILYKNKKCLVNPFILNQELYGMCHIIVIPTNKEINYVQINYPNNEKEKLFYEKNLFKHSFNIFVIICYKKMNLILLQNCNNLNKNRSAIRFL